MIRIGVICPSEIALRRFMPALKKDDRFEFVGIGIASPEEWFNDTSRVSKDLITEQQKREIAKAKTFVDSVGGKIYNSYYDVVTSDDVDAVYLPLPPALHYKWAKAALNNDKHVFVEKPSTTSTEDTKALIALAKEKELALHENYMFVYHNQINAVNDIINSGELGDVRLYRISFGFPQRLQTDFRYNKALGGGALIDAGGYTIKYATCLLGESAVIKMAQMNYIDGFDVDMYGSATMCNDDGVVAQLAYGMDNDYKCELEVWGSSGTLTCNRILTAPAGFTPECIIKKNQSYKSLKLPVDDAFYKSIDKFHECIIDNDTRQKEYLMIQKQADMISLFKAMSK